jgi:hypothetical protein
MMEKERLIGKVFKILPMKELVDKDELSSDELKSYISKQYIYFSGIDVEEKLKFEIVTILKGMKNTCAELSHKEVHDMILRLTNLIDRGL